MSTIALLVIAFALGIDAFSLCIGIGIQGVTKRRILVISFTIAIFHVFMPLIGLALGESLGSFLGPIAAKIGALLLIGIGSYALYKNLKSYGCECKCEDFDMRLVNTSIGLFLLALSVSLDALTVGFSLGTLHANLYQTVAIIGIMAGIMTFFGLILGQKIGCSLGEKAEIFGNVILILVGIKLFLF